MGTRKPATIRVKVPATCANLGAGFDVLGLAIGLHNIFVVNLADATQIEIEGNSAGMPKDESNLFYQAFAHLHKASGKEPPPLHVQMRLLVPPGRGLGSSATAVVGGLMAANALMGEPYTAEQLLPHAVELENGRHADNVAPVAARWAGGERAEWRGGSFVAGAFSRGLAGGALHPEFEMDTVQGRNVCPRSTAGQMSSSIRAG